MKIYRVNMANLTTSIEEVPEEWRLMGGRALTSTIVAKEVDPACNPLGSKNKLVFAPGLLTGTMAANSGRLSVGAKSPLTGGIKESNAGGTAAQRLAKLGVKALIIEGIPPGDKYYCLHVHKDGVNIKEETELLGKSNYEVIHTLTDRYGENTGVMTIGQAGEAKMSAANISVKDPKGHIRSAGRGGLGAVMGSKRIKFITLDDNDGAGIEIQDKEAFKKAAQFFNKGLLSHPVSGDALPKYGTNVLVNILNEAGGLPTKNFRRGNFAGAEKICGETMYDTIMERKGDPTHGCHVGCVIRCSQTYNDKDQKYLTSGFEYETIWGFGAGCEVDDLDIIATADHVCDDLGLDSIEMAVTMQTAMEAGVIPFGDGPGILKLLDEIKNLTALGRILGNGASFTGKAFGLTRVATVKNQGIPAYDPRAVKGVGVTYATTPMGADHTAGYAVATNILKVGGFVDPLNKEGQTDLSRNLQIATTFLDSTGLCIFVAFAVLDSADEAQAMADMVNAQYGTSLSIGEWFEKLGRAILQTEKEFNRAAGLNNNDDRLPEFFSEELPPHNTTWDFTNQELDQVLPF